MPYKITELLRKSQKYIVNIYQGTNIKLTDKNAINKLDCGVSVLKEEFYNSAYGVTTEGSEMELIMF